MSLTAEQQTLKQSLVDTGEEWSPTWENILRLDPTYFAAYVGLRRVPRDKRKLPVKTQELVLLAMDAACTHLHARGVRAHTAAALRAGASAGEILETLEAASVLGVHAVNVGVTALGQVLEERRRRGGGREGGESGGGGGEKGGRDEDDEGLDERRLRLKEEFVRRRGYWSASWPPVLRLSPEFFQAYIEYSTVPVSEGHNHLEPKVREFIFCAIDCSTTHLYQTGLKVHIENAINHGATPEELMEVFELAALMGAQTVMLGADVLTEELEKMENK